MAVQVSHSEYSQVKRISRNPQVSSSHPGTTRWVTWTQSAGTHGGAAAGRGSSGAWWWWGTVPGRWRLAGRQRRTLPVVAL